MAYCFSVTVTLTLTSGLSSKKKLVPSISPILYEIGIPNLVCGYTLGSQSFDFCFSVTMTLTSGLSSRKLCLEHISYNLFEVGIPNLMC